MATTNTNSQEVLYSGDINTAPNKYTTLTGTISTVGRIVTGTGTLFTTEIGGGLSQVGSPTLVATGWIFNGTNEVRRIEAVITNTNMVLEKAFTVDLVGAAVLFVIQSGAVQMSLVEVTAGAIVNGVPFGLNEGTGWGMTSSPVNKTVDPVIIDTTTGSVHVTYFTSN